MKNIKILELTASNFRDQNFHDVYSDTNFLSGKNGSGKSTRIAAWNWLLSGFTDANSPANSRLFDDKSELSDKTPIASVEAVVLIDGETYKIRREAQAAFQRKRGTNETIKSSSDNYFYYIDNISRTATSFKEWLDEHIAKEDMLRFVLSGEYFITKIFDNKKEARQIIEKLVGTVTREEMKGNYECIDELLKKYSLDEIEQRAQNLSRSIDQRLNEIPALIKQKEDEIAEIEQTDFNAVEKEIDELEREYADLDKQMTDLSERLRPQMEARHEAERAKQMKIDVFEKAYQDWRKSFDVRRQKLTDEINAIKQQNEKSAKKRAIEEDTRNMLMSEINRDKQTLEQLKQKRARLVEERDKEKAVTMSESSTLCPHCGAQLQGDKLKEVVDRFERVKRERIDAIVSQGKATASEIERLENKIKDTQSKIDAPLPEVITQPTEYLEKQLLEVVNTDMSKTAFMETEQGRTLVDDIGSVVIPEVVMPDNTEIVNAKKQVNDKLVPLYERRGLRNRLKILCDSADELRAEQKEKGALLADYERQRQSVKAYKQEQMEILSHKVNDGLKCSRIDVWSKQKDGNTVPDLVLKDANGVSFQTTNNASRITTTIDLQRFFCEKLGVRMPVWCDEATIFDSNNLPKFEDTQSFYLFCSDTPLKIESK